jgi:hypothetical protein
VLGPADPKLHGQLQQTILKTREFNADMKARRFQQNPISLTTNRLLAPQLKTQAKQSDGYCRCSRSKGRRFGLLLATQTQVA